MENLTVNDFNLSPQELAAISGLNRNLRYVSRCVNGSALFIIWVNRFNNPMDFDPRLAIFA